jgi:hypothetical protein
MAATSPEADALKLHARSRISNGSAILPGVDGRSTWVRRLRDLVRLHLSDLGGDDAVSEAERSIVRRAATLTVELERLELVFALAGEAAPEQIDLYQRTANSLRRLLRDEQPYFEDIAELKLPKDMMDLASHIVSNKSGHFDGCGPRFWPIASIRTHTLNGRYRRHSGHCSALARNGSVANDPRRT